MPSWEHFWARLLPGLFPKKSEESTLLDWMKSSVPERFALYDLSTDPGQQKDLAQSEPETVEKLTPKMIALFLVMPLLITIANFAGMAGGLAAGGLFLKMPAVVYIAEVKKALIPFDLYWGLVKGLFYSTIISVTGSYMGMKVRGGPASVGRATTSAVVVSIFLVILVDALLSLLFIHIRPGLTL